METQKVAVQDQEFDLPEGVRTVSDDGLYAVDWDLIEIAKEPQEGENPTEFEFFNPRHLGQYQKEDKEVFLGQGFDKESMKTLMNDIAKNGLDYPLLGYWIQKDGAVKVRVNDGERRWRYRSSHRKGRKTLKSTAQRISTCQEGFFSSFLSC